MFAKLLFLLYARRSSSGYNFSNFNLRVIYDFHHVAFLERHVTKLWALISVQSYHNLTSNTSRPCGYYQSRRTWRLLNIHWRQMCWRVRSNHGISCSRRISLEAIAIATIVVWSDTISSTPTTGRVWSVIIWMCYGFGPCKKKEKKLWTNVTQSFVVLLSPLSLECRWLGWLDSLVKAGTELRGLVSFLRNFLNLEVTESIVFWQKEGLYEPYLIVDKVSILTFFFAFATTHDLLLLWLKRSNWKSLRSMKEF